MSSNCEMELDVRRTVSSPSLTQARYWLAMRLLSSPRRTNSPPYTDLKTALSRWILMRCEGVHQQVQQPVVNLDVFPAMHDFALVARARNGHVNDLADGRFGAVGHDDDSVRQEDRLFDVMRDDHDRVGLIVHLQQIDQLFVQGS